MPMFSVILRLLITGTYETCINLTGDIHLFVGVNLHLKSLLRILSILLLISFGTFRN